MSFKLSRLLIKWLSLELGKKEEELLQDPIIDNLEELS